MKSDDGEDGVISADGGSKVKQLFPLSLSE